MDRYRDIVESQLREAMDRGEFDDLPGEGRRLPLGDDSAGWWARRKMEELRRHDEAVSLAQEVERERDRIWSLTDEASVRRAARELNRRVEAVNHLLRQEERLSPLDPETAVTTWRRMARLRSS